MFDDLNEEMENELEEMDDLEENEEELEDDEMYSIIRDVLDQNVETQHLPSLDKFDCDNENERNGFYRLKDDADFTLYDKSSGEYKTYLGSELNEYLLDEYGINEVEYMNGEPDFSNFEISINKSDLFDDISEEDDVKFEGYGLLDKSSHSVDRLGENGTLNEAYGLIANELGCDPKEVKEYLDKNDLVIHEEGMNGFEVIPSDIHNLFRHTGSIGIKKDLEVFAESISNKCDNDSFVLMKNESNCKDIEELKDITSTLKAQNKNLKNQMH